jgi:general secretion pathway protein L
MARKILAIDVQEDSVAAVFVKGGFRSRDVESYAFVPSPDGLVPALNIIAKELAIGNTECVVSLPSSEMSFRNLNVPFKNAKKIRQILPFEMEQSLPLSVENFRFDFTLLDYGDAKDKTHVFAALAKKPYLDACLNDFSNLKLHPVHVTCGGYALAHVLSQNLEFPSQGIVVEGGRKRATLVFVIQGQIQLIRSVLIDPAARSASLCTQIQYTRSAFEAMSGLDVRPEIVMVTGFGFDDRTILREMKDTLEVPVEPIDIVKNTGTRLKGTISADWNPLQFDSAISLAMLELNRSRGINFRDGAFDQKKLLGEHSKSFTKIAVIAGFIITMVGAEYIFDSYRLKQRRIRLDQQITAVFQSTFPDIKRIVDPVHQMRTKIADVQKKTRLKDDSGKSILTIDLLNEISRLIPETMDVEFTRLVVGPENLLIDGNTDTFNAVDEMKNRLETAKLFRGVTISSANIDRAANRVQFKLRGVF